MTPSFGDYIKLARTLRAEGRYAEAVAPLRAALTEQDDPTVRNALVTSLWRTGQHEEAQREGLYNLQLKDRMACSRFTATASTKRHLADSQRGFDPEHRERNIIAFSLWGDKPEYVTGAIINAQIAQHLYMRWTPRFYCDQTVPPDAIAALRAYGAQIVMMDKPEHARIRPLWRFFASDDPTVNVFVCRDTDSRLNAKELIAVQDWLKSGKRFHVMRDHIFHMELMLAGMWGGNAGVLPTISDWLSENDLYTDNRFADQAFLMDCVWPLIREDVCVHDTYYRFPEGARAFPDAYELPGLVHVGGAVKKMPHWSRYVGLPCSTPPKSPE